MTEENTTGAKKSNGSEGAKEYTAQGIQVLKGLEADGHIQWPLHLKPTMLSLDWLHK